MEKSNIPGKENENADNLLIGLGFGTMVMVIVAAFMVIVLIESIAYPKPKVLSESEIKKATPVDPDLVENGIDVETGFIAKGDYLLVKRNCTGCHSAKLVTQNRATREGWHEMIMWMQREQKLADLGKNEPLILDYLAKFYGPEKKGRRENIIIEDWYEISEFISKLPTEEISSIVEPETLFQEMKSETPPIVIEVSKPESFAKSHLPGARNCWRPDFNDTEYYPYGGMRGTSKQIEKLMGQLGVQSGKQVVLYDKKGNSDALRLWWLLQLYGHSTVAVLNGGQPAWEQEGFTLSESISQFSQTDYQFPQKNMRTDLLATRKEVEAGISDKEVFLLDTRSVEEFTGQQHKKGAAKPGKIPTSINLDWAYAIRYRDDFKFKTKRELAGLFSDLGLTPEHKIIVYCHSGVRSSHTTFVLREILGYPQVANYDGSWIEWSHLAEDHLIASNFN